MRALLVLLCVGIVGSAWADCPPASVCLQWGAIATNEDGSAIKGTPWYNIYRGAQGSSVKTLMRTLPAGQLKMTEGSQPSGKQCYNVTTVAVNPADASKTIESVYSNELCVTFALAAPTDGSVEAPSDGSVTP